MVKAEDDNSNVGVEYFMLEVMVFVRFIALSSSAGQAWTGCGRASGWRAVLDLFTNNGIWSSGLCPGEEAS